MTPNNLRVFVP